VKKLNKEFLVRLCDVYWIEASGNYVNLHTYDATFPLPYTTKKFCEQASARGFIRTHRSYAAQSNFIDNITFTDSGDGNAVLLSGTTLPISRRYKDLLKARKSPGAIE
jgi:DNA-binding LytR/AlgR family response regulator